MENHEVVKLLNNYILRVGSANKAAKALGVSNGTISNMISGNHSKIAEQMWRKIGKLLSEYFTGWVFVPTDNKDAIIQTFQHAARNAMVYGIIAPEGSGKDTAAKEYEQNSNVFKVDCGVYLDNKSFLYELSKSMGIDTGGKSVYEMLNAIVDKCLKTDSPLIILNEVDKLSNSVLYFFITLYNKLEGKCGIVTLATSYFKTRIENGVNKNKRGFREIYSRYGKTFIELNVPTYSDIENICKANGITDKITIREIYNLSKGDLRVVKTAINAEKDDQHAAA